MQISNNTWHYRVFDWWFRATMNNKSFADYNQWHKRVYGVEKPFNLCPYVRVVMFWGPLRFLFSAPRLKYTLIAMFALIQFHGALIWGRIFFRAEFAMFVTALSVALLLTAVVSSVWLTQFSIRKYRQYKNIQPPKGENSFYVILRKYFKTAHDGICPQITFVGDEDV